MPGLFLAAASAFGAVRADFEALVDCVLLFGVADGLAGGSVRSESLSAGNVDESFFFCFARVASVVFGPGAFPFLFLGTCEADVAFVTGTVGAISPFGLLGVLTPAVVFLTLDIRECSLTLVFRDLSSSDLVSAQSVNKLH